MIQFVLLIELNVFKPEPVMFCVLIKLPLRKHLEAIVDCFLFFIFDIVKMMNSKSLLHSFLLYIIILNNNTLCTRGEERMTELNNR